jgi:hypothetical protein
VEIIALFIGETFKCANVMAETRFKKKNKKKKKNCQFEPEFTIVNEIITRVPE